MAPMKVLYFHQHFSTPSGSTGIRSYEMAKQLIAAGHQVTMVCGSYDSGVTGLSIDFNKGFRRGIVHGIDVIEFDLAYSNKDGFVKRIATFIKFAFFSTKLVFTEPYDIIVASSTPLTAGIPGIVGRWLKRKPFIFEVRDLWPELPKAMGAIKNRFALMGMSCLEWLSYHSAQRLIGLSPGIVDGIARRGVAAKNIKLLPNGCDLRLFSFQSMPWRPSGINADDYLAVFAGTHGLANGLDAVIDAAIELKHRGRNDIKILLIGHGKLKKSLQERAESELLNNVIFHEPVDKDRLSGLMQSAHLGLQILANIPSFYYGTSPNKFFDYIASGLPVLNNYPGWLADLIKQNDCGLVVEPGSSKAFADALEYAADNREVLYEKGVRARQLAEKEFDRVNIAKSFVAWVEECCYVNR